MKAAIKGLLSSKKFVAALLAGLAWGLGKLGLKMSSEEIGGIVTPLLVYILGQGVADISKPAALPPAEPKA